MFYDYAARLFEEAVNKNAAEVKPYRPGIRINAPARSRLFGGRFFLDPRRRQEGHQSRVFGDLGTLGHSAIALRPLKQKDLRAVAFELRLGVFVNVVNYVRAV